MKLQSEGRRYIPKLELLPTSSNFRVLGKIIYDTNVPCVRDLYLASSRCVFPLISISLSEKATNSISLLFSPFTIRTNRIKARGGVSEKWITSKIVNVY